MLGNKLIVRVLLAVLALVIIGGGAYLYFSIYGPVYEKEFGMDVKVVPPMTVGFNVDTDALHFGKISPGGTGTRFINLQHSYKVPLRVHATVDGQLGPWAAIPENDIVLNPGDAMNFSVAITIPGDTALGNYTGKLRLALYKVEYKIS